MSPEISPSQREDPVIEMLRGLAACMVVGTHYASMVATHPGLWGFASTGVDLFFVLSGYVFAPYLHGRPLATLPHLVRRFFRLVPLYWTALACYLLLSSLQGRAMLYVPEHFLFLHTARSLEIATYYNSAFWSLPPEVEFYLVLPILAWAATRWRLAWGMALAVAMHLALVAAADPASQAVTARAIATIHLPGLLCEFALGAMAWHLVQTAPGGKQRALRLVLGLLALAATMALFHAFIADTGAQRDPAPLWIGGNMGLLAATAYALLVSTVAGAPGAARQVPLAAFWFWLGQCSYGVYLLHNASPQALQLLGWKPQGWAGILACILLTLGAAWMAHKAIEHPMRTWGRRISLRWQARPRPAQG